MTMNTCRICGGTTSFLGVDKFLGRHRGEYECCNVCGFTFVRDPYWLNEAYSSAITSIDLGSVYRCELYSGLLKTLLHVYSNPQAKFVDYGGGYGLLVRRMRDLGYDYHWFDKHCGNLFAQGFEASRPSEARYETLSAFEVFEHLSDPVGEMGSMVTFADQIIFSTELITRPAPTPGTWWYYAPEHGQHISFYTWDSLNRLARRFNLHFVTNGTIHMFSKLKVSRRLFKIIMSPRVSRTINTLLRQESLLQRDFGSVRQSLIKNKSR